MVLLLALLGLFGDGPFANRVLRSPDGRLTVSVHRFEPLHDRMRKARVDEGDIVESARELRGLRSMDEVDHAILERGGHISIVPKPGVYASRT